MLHFFDPACEEFRTLTRDDPSAFAPPPAFGPFRVLHQVGVGALGPVFRTYEPTRDRLIAVKVFRLDITPEQAQSLAEELSRAAEASLFHPSIVEPIAAGVQGTVAYRAEEYVAAESLDVAMRHYAPAPINKVLPFVTQLAGAIDFARAAGVGHGALHPRDVFVTPDEARVAGFGVVEALERIGVRAPVRRPYTAPERIEGGAWATPADVFSLAAITFELLTGRRAAGTGSTVGALTGADVGRHEQAMHAVFARAMDENPARRYPSALAFASALEAASRGVVETGADVATAAAAVALAGVDETEIAPRIAVKQDPAPARDDEIETPVAAAAAPIVTERVVQPEGEEAFAGPEPVEDVDAERDEDEAYHALLETERRERDALEAAQERTLFDERDTAPVAARYVDVRDDDLPLRSDEDGDVAPVAAEPEPEPQPVRRTHEPATHAMTEFAAATPAARTERIAAPLPPPQEPRDGLRMLPLALTLIAGLLLGFAAGYFVRGRDMSPQQASSSLDSASPAGSGQPGGREWSEQAVAPQPNAGAGTAQQPPSAPPPVPNETAETPAATRARPEGPRPAVTRGRLLVESTPSRAGVTLNGRWRGRTPLVIDDLPFGRYTVRIVQPGYAIAREQVALSRTQAERTVSFKLEPERRARTAAAQPAPAAPERASSETNGALFVDSRPRGAQVFVDGRLVGTTPLRLPGVPIGSHVVRLELKDHRRWSTSASVAAARETRVTGSLDPIQ